MTRHSLNAFRAILLASCVALLATACSTSFVRDTGLDKLAPRKAEQALSAGIRAYEDGNYKSAQKYLQGALDEGLILSSDKAVAHKYLAFVQCAHGRETLCRQEFRELLELEPRFELEPSEAGHPAWGPVFKSVKAEMARKQPK
jgi:Tfp pilus assembly protein PilF